MKLLFTILFKFSFIVSYTQSINQQVISASGTSFSNDEYIIESTLGESVISTLENDKILTQGFHQTSLKISSISESSDIKLKLYPNPNVGVFTVEFEKRQKISVILSTLNGQDILTEKLDNNIKKTFDISELPQGIYLLKVLDTNNKQSVFKINKLR